MADIGLLGAMVYMDVKTLLEGNNVFEEFKRALTEQFVLQQLVTAKGLSVYYWFAESGNAEIDFLIQIAGQVVPVEVKAKENLHAKSLKKLLSKI